MIEKKEEHKKIGLLYLGLHNQLKKKYGVNSIISRKEFFCKLGKHYQLPTSLRHWVINEMEKVNLIEKINRDSIKILPCKVDIEKLEDQNKIAQLINLIICD
jgi:hypothetical protein